MGWLLARLNLWNFTQWNKWNGEQETMQSTGDLVRTPAFPKNISWNTPHSLSLVTTTAFLELSFLPLSIYCSVVIPLAQGKDLTMWYAYNQDYL